MDLSLSDKTVLITGSHRGTGAGTARVFAAEGARVAVHGFEHGQPDEVVAQIEAAGGTAVPVIGDLLDSVGAQQVVDQTVAALGDVQILVNNYGAPGRSGWDTPAEAWVDGWNRNVLSAVRVTQLVVPAMRDAGWGRIIWLGTVGTERPGDRNPDYYGSKAAIPALVRSLAKDLRGSGITSNLVSPGMIATAEVREMLQRRAERDGLDRSWDVAQRHALDNQMPNLTERIPEPEDIGAIVAFVASEAAWHLNGADIKADGGALDA
jgi:3-oxoacyl-[acyl-carrier protein] reductase